MHKCFWISISDCFHIKSSQYRCFRFIIASYFVHLEKLLLPENCYESECWDWANSRRYLSPLLSYVGFWMTSNREDWCSRVVTMSMQLSCHFSSDCFPADRIWREPPSPQSRDVHFVAPSFLFIKCRYEHKSGKVGFLDFLSFHSGDNGYFGALHTNTTNMTPRLRRLHSPHLAISTDAEPTQWLPCISTQYLTVASNNLSQ